LVIDVMERRIVTTLNYSWVLGNSLEANTHKK